MLASIIDLNHSQHYIHWSILTISLANVIIIATMVIIFGLAILLPFPKGKYDATQMETLRPHQEKHADTDKMWTARVRNFFLYILPPGKLLPDRQPAYVSSWIYVFGVATLAALGMVVLSGAILAIGGVNWWHESELGHFVNSVHLWGVELFMAFMVIHLWGKFWMAAWRGKRWLTWMTGVIAFAASILTCFTGYLSQQNFDAQWISTNGKDAFNAAGIGSILNLMNFGQMLTWHVVIMPLILAGIVVLHILLVRVRGVSHPIQKARSSTERRTIKAAEAAEWRGQTRRYDIIKEGAIATGIVLALSLVLAGLLSSPDEPPLTIATWAKIAPADFMATAASELAGTSETATYGPPYTNDSSAAQKIVFSPQAIAGVHQQISSAQTFVLSPLAADTPGNPSLTKALSVYNHATVTQQQAWNKAFADAVTKVSFSGSGAPSLPKTDDGPIPTMITSELNMARSGALDTALLAQQPFYGTDYTKPLLFMEDGNYFASKAEAQHLTGEQWGVMNETGNFPGQPWLWLYTLWYQIPSFSASANVDLIAIYLTGASTLLLLLVPFIPGIRDIPRLIPIHRLIWRQWYRHSAR